MSWGALFAGAIVAVATWILLYAIGLAVGLSSVSPDDLSSAKVAGIGTGIWSIIAPLIALFVGGAVAGRLAGSESGGDGALHGIVVWGLTTIAGLLMIGMLLSNLIGGVIGLGKTAVGAGAEAGAAAAASPDTGAAQAPGQGALAALGLDYDALLAPVNRRLAAEGAPPVTTQQLQGVVQDAVPSMVMSGSFNRDTLLSALAANTAMSRAEAEQVASSVEAKFNASKESFKANAQEKALVAADTTGKAFWGISAALLLGLGSAAAGGAVAANGVRRRRMRIRERTVTYVPRPASATP